MNKENQDIKYFPIKKFPDINFMIFLKSKIKEKKKKLKIKEFELKDKLKLN